MIGRVTMLESLVDVLLPHRAGVLELPEWYGAALFAALAKGAMHKYIKRVPKPGGGYRYFYTVGGGGGVHHADHFVEGASFKHEGGHYHIAKAEGDTVHIRHDESGETKKVSKAELGAMLAKHHEAGLKAHREKAAARLAEAKANKASPKQIARLEAQAKAADTQKPTRSVHPDAKKALHGEVEYHERSGSVPPGLSDDDYKYAHRMNAEAYRLAADGHEDPYYIAEKAAGHGASRARFQQALSAARDAIDRASKEDKKARHAEASRPPDESASAETVAAWVKDAERKIQQTKGSSYAKELQAQVDQLRSRGNAQAKSAGHSEETKAMTNPESKQHDAPKFLDWVATKEQATSFIEASNTAEKEVDNALRALPSNLQDYAWRILNRHDRNLRFGDDVMRRPTFSKFGEHKDRMKQAWEAIKKAYNGVPKFSDSDIALEIRDDTPNSRRMKMLHSRLAGQQAAG